MEVFGPLSLQALERDELRRKVEGFLPTADVAFLDEIFKAPFFFKKYIVFWLFFWGFEFFFVFCFFWLGGVEVVFGLVFLVLLVRPFCLACFRSGFGVCALAFLKKRLPTKDFLDLIFTYMIK